MREYEQTSIFDAPPSSGERQCPNDEPRWLVAYRWARWASFLDQRRTCFEDYSARVRAAWVVTYGDDDARDIGDVSSHWRAVRIMLNEIRVRGWGWRYGDTVKRPVPREDAALCGPCPPALAAAFGQGVPSAECDADDAAAFRSQPRMREVRR